jgi:hypothetical protein
MNNMIRLVKTRDCGFRRCEWYEPRFALSSWRDLSSRSNIRFGVHKDATSHPAVLMGMASNLALLRNGAETIRAQTFTSREVTSSVGRLSSSIDTRTSQDLRLCL